MKKIADADISQVVKKVTWTSGITYDMWRNDIDRDNPSQPSGSFDIYDANYYVLNSDFRVYICLDNNASPENNFQGGPSLDEPTFTDLGQELLVPVVMVIFGNIFTQSNHLKLLGLTQLIIFLFQMSGKPIQLMLPLEITHTSGQLKIIKIRNRGVGLGTANLTYVGVPIKGDGIGAKATVVINNDSEVETVTVSHGGNGYTYGTLDLAEVGIPSWFNRSCI